MRHRTLRGLRRECSTSVVCVDSFKTRSDLPLIGSAGLRRERFVRCTVCIRTIAGSLTHTVRRVSRRSRIESANGKMGCVVLRRGLGSPCPPVSFFTHSRQDRTLTLRPLRLAIVYDRRLRWVEVLEDARAVQCANVSSQVITMPLLRKGRLCHG